MNLCLPCLSPGIDRPAAPAKTGGGGGVGGGEVDWAALGCRNWLPWVLTNQARTN